MGERQRFISPGANRGSNGKMKGKMSGSRRASAGRLRGGDAKWDEFLLPRCRLVERGGGGDRKMCIGTSTWQRSLSGLTDAAFPTCYPRKRINSSGLNTCPNPAVSKKC